MNQVEYVDLIMHFGSNRSARTALAEYVVLGEIPPGLPKEWDIDDLAYRFIRERDLLAVGIRKLSDRKEPR